MAVLCVAASLGVTGAFVNKPLLVRASRATPSSSAASVQPASLAAFKDLALAPFPASRRSHRGGALKMASADFDQMQYTEAAWSVVAAVTKVAEYHKSSTVEAPLILDFMLNPGKHNGGDDAESAKSVTVKVLEQAGLDVKQLRQGLEEHLSRQPKMSQGGSQNIMGRDLPKVLENARTIQSILGVSEGDSVGQR